MDKGLIKSGNLIWSEEWSPLSIYNADWAGTVFVPTAMFRDV